MRDHQLPIPPADSPELAKQAANAVQGVLDPTLPILECGCQRVSMVFCAVGSRRKSDVALAVLNGIQGGGWGMLGNAVDGLEEHLRAAPKLVTP